jgi:polyhydroxybutyrate depolymerase
MKRNLLLFIFVIFCFQLDAQWSTKSFVYQSQTRQYMVYKPSCYNVSNPASIVITLHGLGDNMSNFSTLGFNYIADTANIVVVCPQAISDPFAGTAWNSGAGQSGYYPNSSVNDVGFLNTLVDTIKKNFSIDPSSVYICGFSMGGFMTERMALQSNTKYAAFASMSGTVGDAITTYAPGRHVPIAHFHGTLDSTVYYYNNAYGIDPLTLVNFWMTNNVCGTVPDSSRFADAASDGITVDLFKFSGSSINDDVWFYRMNGADHTVLYQPNNDITEIIEIWKFFRRHNNIMAGTNDQNASAQNIQFYPNPASSFIDIQLPEASEKASIEIFSAEGKCLYSKEVSNNFHQVLLDEEKFVNGIYILRVTGDKVNAARQLIIQR